VTEGLGGVLDGKVALVTGSSRGMGKAIAMAFAENGASVAVTARTAAALDDVVAAIRNSGGTAIAVPADLEDTEGLPQIVETVTSSFGGLDILVNNAGLIKPFKDLVDFTPDEWRRTIEVNLVAPAMLIRAVLPTMIAQKSGRIINISSKGGRRGKRQRTAYSSSKAGVITLTESVAAEVKQHGIDVVCICPNATDTEGMREAFPDAKFDSMRPEEIASLAVFLATDASSAIAGSAIDAFGVSNPIFAGGAE
jgi:NAD(P)-dependent dehydrogenase (short-subunit alcohol dehydrogenase family)